MLIYGLQALFLLVAAVMLGYMCGRFLRWLIKGVDHDTTMPPVGFSATTPLAAGEAEAPAQPAARGGHHGAAITPSERARAVAPLVIQDRAARPSDPSFGATTADPATQRPQAATKQAAPATMTPPARPRAEPFGLTRPRAGGADDLQQISGIGPKIEHMLNSFGVFHFDQIAGWTEADIAAIDNKLNYSGRISREGWVGQARKLAGH